MTTLADRLEAAVRSGDWEPLRGHVHPAVALRTSNERGRLRLDGADAVLEHLGGPGAGDVAHWHPREWPAGVALTFEWTGERGTDRRRWYVRRDADGLVTEVWSSAARPGAADDGDPPPPAWLAELGVTATAPLVHGGNSGAALLRGTRADGSTLVLKRVRAGADWLARATRDDARTARLFDAGAFTAMPAVIESGVVAVVREGAVAWIAMDDVAPHLLGDEARLSRAESRRVLDASAALHAAFHGRVPDGAADLADRLGMASPAVAEAERPHSDLLPKQFEHAWEAFAEVVDADVAEPVLALARDPRPLAERLLRANGAATLAHGDLRDDNLGFDGERVILIDWDLATAGTPTVDFAWYLAQDAWRIDATRDELEADHRAAHGDALADQEVELGLVSGLVQYGWLLAHSARVHPDPAETAWGREELGWWVPRVRRALEATS